MSTMKKTSKISKRIVLLVIFSAFLTGQSCQDEVKEWADRSENQVISDYVYNNPELFEKFGKLLEKTGIDNVLRVRGPFTLLIPTNDAMFEYYDSKGITSYSELDSATMAQLVYSHIFNGEISSGAIGLGTLTYKNGLNDFVASDFSGSDILLNKVAIIIKRDIRTANGTVHIIDHVLEPVEENVIEKLVDYGGYSIFLEGLELSGLKDTLAIISFPFGNAIARTRYTVLAVPDSVYNRYGIMSVDDLVNRYDSGEELSDHENEFFKYMEYHCLNGTHYFSDFEPDAIYQNITFENYLNIKVEEDFKINKNDTTYTGFFYSLSNIPAKNGVIHTVNTLLEHTVSTPVKVLFQVTDYFDLEQGPYYLDHYSRFYDGQNTFENIKWEADYLMYYYKPAGANGLIDGDCLNMNGHFWIEIKTPIIRKGKYDLRGSFFMGEGYAIMSVHFDGEYIGIANPNIGSWGGPPISMGELELTETRKHTIKLETLTPGQMFWDYIQFVPI